MSVGTRVRVGKLYGYIMATLSGGDYYVFIPELREYIQVCSYEIDLI